MTPAQILDGLTDAFRLLTGSLRGVLPRQATLEASITWSHDLLSPSERALFRRLAVFAGGFTLDAAEVVGAGPGVEATGVLERALAAGAERAETEYSLGQFLALKGRTADAEAHLGRALTGRPAFPAAWVRERKFWPYVGRIDNVWGDRNLFCACPPMESYSAM